MLAYVSAQQLHGISEKPFDKLKPVMFHTRLQTQQVNNIWKEVSKGQGRKLEKVCVSQPAP